MRRLYRPEYSEHGLGRESCCVSKITNDCVDDVGFNVLANSRGISAICHCVGSLHHCRERAKAVKVVSVRFLLLCKCRAPIAPDWACRTAFSNRKKELKTAVNK
jgi:hypothetical protein